MTCLKTMQSGKSKQRRRYLKLKKILKQKGFGEGQRGDRHEVQYRARRKKHPK